MIFSAWSDEPVAGLAAAIRSAVGEFGDGPAEPPDGQSLADVIAWAAETADAHLLIILDQFEEYFLYHGVEARPGAFAAEFPGMLNRSGVQANLLVSIREDALAKLDRFKRVIPRLFDSTLRINHLDAAAAREAIVRPVERYNALAAADERVVLEAGLVAAVIEQVRSGRVVGEQIGQGTLEHGDGAEVGADRIETPYLQLVMSRLWDVEKARGSPTLRAATLAELGGAQEIVRTHLDGALRGLDLQERDTAAALFHQLVTPSGTKIAHAVPDLAEYAHRPEPEVRDLLEKLARSDTRILRPVPPPPGEEGPERFEIFHDVLADGVLAWCARHEAERERAALAEQVREEDRARRKERRDRLLRRLAVILGLVVIALLAVLFPTLAKERKARSIGLATAATGQIAVDPERAVLIAREAVKAKETDRAREALGSAVAASHILARMGHQRATGCGAACRPQPAVASRIAPPAVLTTPSFGTERQQQQVSFTPDGRNIVAVVNGEVRIWEPETGDYETVPRITDAQAARISPDGRSVLILGVSGAAHVASLTGDGVWRVPGAATSVALSADGQFVASASRHQVTVRRVRDETSLAMPIASAGSIANVEFNPVDPGQIMVASVGSVRLWHWRTSALQHLVGATRVQAAPVGAIAARFSPDGRSVAAVEPEGRARVVDLAPLKRHQRTPLGMVSQAIMSPRSDRLLTVEGRTATLRDPHTGKVMTTLGGHDAAINSAVFGPDGRFVATGSSDGTARVWDVASGNQTLELRGHAAAVTDVAFSPDGQRLVTDGEDGTTRLWDISPGRLLRLGASSAPLAMPRSDGKVAVLDRTDGAVRLWTPGQSGSVRAAGYEDQVVAGAVSPNGELLAASGHRPGHGLVLRNLETGASKTLARRPVDLLAFSPDAHRLFALKLEASGPPFARMWDVVGQEVPLAQPELPKEDYNAIVWGPGDRVLLTSSGGPPHIIDAATGHVQQLSRPSRSGLPTHTAQGGGFSPHGRLVVTAGARQALVWRTKTRRISRRLVGHTAPLTTAAFSPNGRWVVTGDESGAVRIWNLHTARSVMELPTHGARVLTVGFTPSSDQVVSSADDGTVRVYDCVPCRPFAELLALAKIRVTRELTTGEKRAFLGESD